MSGASDLDDRPSTGGRRPTQAERMVDAARTLQAQSDPTATMREAVRTAVANVAGCDVAAISVLERGGHLQTPAYTDDLAVAADVLQRRLGEGPCVRAVWDERLVQSGDLATDRRWPAWAPRAARDLGVHALLCVRLFTRDDTLGALSLYSRTPEGFGSSSRDEAIALAGHVSVAIADSLRSDHLAHALDTRTLIGQASGILMERYQLDAAQAFSVLSRVSADTNTKLREVARRLVDSRELPH